MAESSSVDGFNVDRDASSDSDIDNKDDGHLHTPAKERRRRTFLFYSPSSSRPSRKKKNRQLGAIMSLGGFPCTC